MHNKRTSEFELEVRSWAGIATDIWLDNPKHSQV